MWINHQMRMVKTIIWYILSLIKLFSRQGKLKYTFIRCRNGDSDLIGEDTEKLVEG